MKDSQESMARYVVNSSWIFLAILISNFFMPLCSASGGEAGDEIDDLFYFNGSDGIDFMDSMYLNGTITHKADNYSWEVIDIFDLDEDDQPNQLISGQFLDTVVPISENLWEWSLELNISSLNCTCNFIITSIYFDSNGTSEEFESALLVYLGETNHHPYVKAESIVNSKIDEVNYSISFTIITPSNLLNGTLNSQGANLLLNANYCQAPSNVCLGAPIPTNLNYTVDQDQIEVVINQQEMNIEDGYWLFEFSIQDAYLRSSNVFTSRIILDSTSPIVELTSPINSTESQSFLVYASIDDGFIGSQVTLTWTITDPEGNSRGLMDDESYHNSTIELTINTSGYWDIQILVRDSANFIVKENITILIENIPPVIDLDLNGLGVNDGDELILTEDSSWILNATGSYDTSNDVNNLVFEWYIDGIKFDSNKSIITNNDVKLTGGKQFSLVLYDDDMESDNLTFKITISTESNDSFSFQYVIISSIGILLLIIIIGVKLVFRSVPRNSELPKWRSKN